MHNCVNELISCNSENVHKLKTQLFKHKDKEKSNYAFLKQRETENTGFLGVARRYFLRIIFSKFFTDL